MSRRRIQNLPDILEEDAVPSAPAMVNGCSPEDGLPIKRHKEDELAFEARARASLQEIVLTASRKVQQLKITILLAYIRHLREGQICISFIFKDESGLAIADFSTIETLERIQDPDYLLLKEQIDISKKISESRWINHLGDMATGRAGGNIKAMELFTRRFFQWDADVSGHEEAKAVRAAFLQLSKDWEAPIDI